jgi:hypothetical protein
MFQEVEIPAMPSLQVICHRCDYTWNSTTAAYRPFLHCPHCGTTVMINPIRGKKASKMKHDG